MKNVFNLIRINIKTKKQAYHLRRERNKKMIKINEIKNKDSKNIVIEFNGNIEELPKFENFLEEKNIFSFNKNEGIAAIFKYSELKQLVEILKMENSFEFENGIEKLEEILQENRLIWKGNRFEFDLTTESVIYSILNITPDSFYDGGRNSSVDKVLKRIEEDIRNGAKIFEFGGKSSKPNFDDISAEEEWNRIEKYIEAVKKQFPDIVLALDSDTEEVIEKGLDTGIDIINDFNGFTSEGKLKLVEKYKPALVVMNNGRFDKIPNLKNYLENYFDERVKAILETGIEKEKISIDPGVGYSSNNSMNTPEDIERIKSIKYLRNMRLPIMIAISRKSFNEKVFGLSLEERLMGTLMFESLMVQDGGRILRVHDVKETKDILNMLEVYNKI